MFDKKIDEVCDGINQQTADGLFEFANNDASKGEITGYSNYSYWHSTWLVFTKNKVAMFFLIVMTVLIAFTLVQPYIPGQKDSIEIHINPETNLPDANQPPSDEYIFGTNSIGQDLWSRIWGGTRTSLVIGLTVGACNAIIGVVIGALWGYVRKLDRVITEIYNVLHNIPSSIILILASYIMSPSISTIIIAMSLTGWLVMARFVRNQIVIIRDREFNLASRCLGTPTSRLIVKNLLPHLVSVIVMRVALAIPLAIGQEVFLTYIGLGLPINIPSLGNLINEGRIVMMSPLLRYQLIFPAVILSIITISFYVMGNAFADAADPKNHV